MCGGCLEQIAEASKELENLQFEYNMVTSYLKDMEEIEALPKEEKEILSECAKKIDALEKQQSCSYRQSFLGKEMEVLLEEEVVIDGKIYMTGHTKEYIRAALPGNAGVPNELIYGHFNGFLRENIVLLQ